ncbi:MAG: septation protein IspZ [Proteobacteria bacterium]|nr:septation protein IspZ [Pseudomonadota bacterium]
MNLLRAFRPLVGDFLSTIIFIAIYEVTDDIITATGAGIVTGIVQFLWLKFRRHDFAPMQYASLALVLVLGTATLLTRDPRFVMVKPSIAGFAIATVMLQRGWQLRYMPPIVKENAPETFLVMWGYIWSALYYAMAAGNLFISWRFGLKEWAPYNAFVPTVGPLMLFVIQYVTMRAVIRRAIMAKAAAGTMPAPAE